MSDRQKVIVVTIESRRYFDECERSYLPLYKTVFGVYKSKENALKDVWKSFGSYEINLDYLDENGEYMDFDDSFKFIDETYGGYAIYCVKYSEETVIESK